MYLSIFFLVTSLGACSAGTAPVTAAITPGALSEALPPATITPTASATATATETPTPTITVTATRTPTATRTLHPLDIRAARLTPYPGSEIVIEETLVPGSNYARYYAYYISEGLRIYGLLTVPYATMPASGYPAIVFNHGYIPPDVYRTTERYIAYVDNLARSGYVVFRIDYRGHDRSEGVARGPYGDPGYLADVLNAVAALKRYPLVDYQRIGMWGHSMGGYLTLRAMTVSPDIRAGVIWAGVVASYPDLMCCWYRGAGSSTPTPNPSSSRGWRLWTARYGSPEQNPDFWNGISANSYLAEISGPLQLHHGTGDEDVPYAFSLNLFNEMLRLGLTVEYYQYEGDNHNLSGYFTQAMNRTLEFYERNLKNVGE